MDRIVQQAGDDPALAVAEVRLAVTGEDLRDGAARRALDLVIGVDEGEAKAMGETLADAALAGPHQPDENDGLRRHALRRVALRSRHHCDPAVIATTWAGR